MPIYSTHAVKESRMVDVPELDELEEVWEITDAPLEMPEANPPHFVRKVALTIAFGVSVLIVALSFLAVIEFWR
jgi:hypothetical protein